MALLLPLAHLLARRVQHPLAEGENHAGALGQRNEFLGADGAEVRIGPAGQGFHADDATVGGAGQRLVVQQQFALGHRPAQVGLQGQPAHGLLAHGRREEPEHVLAVGLGMVHGGVGVHQQGLGVGAVHRAQGDADAGGDHHIVPAQVHGPAQHLVHAPGHHGSILGIVDFAQQDGELVAAQPRQLRAGGIELRPGDGVRAAHAAGQAPGGLHQHQVAGAVAEGVVDALEVVQVQEQHRQHAAVAARQVQGLVDPLLEQQPVRQAGEAVVVGHAVDLLLRAGELGDVLGGATHPAAAVALAAELAALLQVDQGAVIPVNAEPGGAAAAEGSVPEPFPHVLPVVPVHPGDDVIQSGLGAPLDPQQQVPLLGAGDPVGVRIPFPVAQPGQALGVGQVLPAAAQLVVGPVELLQQGSGAQHVAQPAADDGPLDGLGGEIGGARVVGTLDGVQVVQAGGHHHRYRETPGVGADAPADLETVQVGEVHVQHHQVGAVALERLQGGAAVLGGDHPEALLPQGGFRNEAGRGVVVHHQQARRGGTVSREFNHRPPPCRRPGAAPPRRAGTRPPPGRPRLQGPPGCRCGPAFPVPGRPPPGARP